MTATCETCKHYNGMECTFMPPLAGKDKYGNYANHRPLVNGFDSCGQHESKVVVNRGSKSVAEYAEMLSNEGYIIPGITPGTEPEDGLHHTNGVAKNYINGHTYVIYHGVVTHDPDCICFKKAYDGKKSHKEEDQVCCTQKECDCPESDE